MLFCQSLSFQYYQKYEHISFRKQKPGKHSHLLFVPQTIPEPSTDISCSLSYLTPVSSDLRSIFLGLDIRLMMSPSQTVLSTESRKPSVSSRRSNNRQSEDTQTPKISTFPSSRGNHHHQHQQSQGKEQQQHLNDYLNANRHNKPAVSRIASWLEEPVREQPWNELRVQLLRKGEFASQSSSWPEETEFELLSLSEQHGLNMDLNLDMDPSTMLNITAFYTGSESLSPMASTSSLSLRSRSYTGSSSSSSSQSPAVRKGARRDRG